MAEELGLRERKKQRTRQTIFEEALRLFLSRGFDEVSIAEIAEAAEVSKRTLFAYFPTKEDLVLHVFADHADESARVVRARPAGTSPLAALYAHELDALARRDPNTGLTSDPDAVAFARLLSTTASLSERLLRYMGHGITALAEALEEAGADELTARLAAVQIVTVLRTLAARNSEQVQAGRPADEVHPEAVAAAERAFRLLGTGLADALPY
ncbi:MULTISPECIES: TetR/AcrR family transcriptional regulator [Streptomyces]|uniref:TetR family transcriptional regulator n=1 Tax=Streptomyces katrae TaxID=68223 RepID=A0ABT7GW80_9ACTN|nr:MULTISPECIES: TetR/AcrR family transcriptional regulator [Streptomyces]MDK9497149.1 TetR family transcriptional regulator [Streptomyces katrae]RST04265.1 TetR/AcrR family transcriptional regulator [Streptomyces sp. WAC07149]GLX23316.1 TetR family transcriptional regulator [Streptomyces lavendulae subsp. lavendulae]GLX30779.1 TetR family transcriptional regulator [Streptomyces lavendulae subsp. lavendulae]